MTDNQLNELERLLNLGCTPYATQIKIENDVYRLDCGADVFFLKIYTKPWYGSDVAHTGFNANHEACAWAILTQHQLGAPEVVYVATDGNNPIARPFLITRQVPGTPLTTLLLSTTDGQQHVLLATVGAYMRRMHSITFPFTGYLTTVNGPTTPPNPNGWQHRCWTARARQNSALAYLEQERSHLSAATYTNAYARCSHMSDQLGAAYQIPRFTHGDCHAHQFFLAEEAEQWQVAGVIDMEVASAGDCVEDLLEICIELAQTLPHETNWWEPLFAGYGGAPNFEHFRLRLLGVTFPEFGGSGQWLDGAPHELILRHVLHAVDWNMLFGPIS